MSRVTLGVISDTHGGHKLGLMNPDTVLRETGLDGKLEPCKPELTATQKQVYEWYRQDVDKVLTLAEKKPLVLFDLGDNAHGIFRPGGLANSSLANQLLTAMGNLDPWLVNKNLKAIYFASGTEIHDMGESSASILIMNDIQKKRPDVKVGLVHHGLLDIFGKTIDYAHHGPFPGSREWLMGNVAMLYLKDIMMKDIMRGKQPPDLVLRGHYHEYVPLSWTMRAGNHDYHSQLVIMPSYFLFDDWTMRVMKSKQVHSVGCVAFKIYDDILSHPYPFIREIDMRTREVYSG